MSASDSAYGPAPRQATSPFSDRPTTCSAAQPSNWAASEFHDFTTPSRSQTTTPTCRVSSGATTGAATGPAGPGRLSCCSQPSPISSRTQTRLAVLVYVTPQASASRWASARPRPEVAGCSSSSVAGGGAPEMVRPGWWSSTSISSLAGHASTSRRQVSSTPVPAWTTAFVTSSLVSRTASSARWASRHSASTWRTNLRACAGAWGLPSKAVLDTLVVSTLRPRTSLDVAVRSLSEWQTDAVDASSCEEGRDGHAVGIL